MQGNAKTHSLIVFFEMRAFCGRPRGERICSRHSRGLGLDHGADLARRRLLLRIRQQTARLLSVFRKHILQCLKIAGVVLAFKHFDDLGRGIGMDRVECIGAQRKRDEGAHGGSLFILPAVSGLLRHRLVRKEHKVLPVGPNPAGANTAINDRVPSILLFYLSEHLFRTPSSSTKTVR